MNRYQQLLSATVAHLRQLKQDGVRFLPLQYQEIVSELVSNASASPSRPSRSPAQTQTPAPANPNQPEPPPYKKRTAKEKTDDLNRLRSEARNCAKCPHLKEKRLQVVFGAGLPTARLMFVGVAPGKAEDKLGKPFQGPSGELLDKILGAMGLNRRQVYLAYILNCRAFVPENPDRDRAPNPDELTNCHPWLTQQIRIVHPEVLVAFGALAFNQLTGKSATNIKPFRGKFHDFEGIPVMPTHHPSSVIRHSSMVIKRQLWEDLLQVMERLIIPISEKQRTAFIPHR